MANLVTSTPESRPTRDMFLSHKFTDSGPFLHKSFPLRKPNKARTSFEMFADIMKEIASKIPEKRYCRIIESAMERSSMAYASVMSEVNSYRTRKNFRHEHGIVGITDTSQLCRKLRNRKHDTKDAKKAKQAVDIELVRFYNTLPLPFQCHVLYRVALGKQGTNTKPLRNSLTRRSSQNSRQKVSRSDPYNWDAARDQSPLSLRTLKELPIDRGGPPPIREDIESTSYDTPVDRGPPPPLRGDILPIQGTPIRHEETLHRHSEASLLLGLLVQSAESEIRKNHDMLPVARQCRKAFIGDRSHTNTLRISVFLRNSTKIDRLKANLRKLIPETVLSFVREYPVKLPRLSILRPRQLSVDLFSVRFVKTQELRKKTILHIKVHVKKDKFPALNANLVLGSIYNYGLKKFQRTVSTKLKYRSLDFSSEAPSNITYDKPKRMFPTYLVHYFRDITRKQKCYLLRTLATHVNQNFERILSILPDVRHFRRDVCQEKTKTVRAKTKKNMRDNLLIYPSRTDEREVYTEHPPTVRYHPPQGIKGEEMQPASMTRATMIEIGMIVVLSLLFVFALVFFSTCAVFIRRKKRMKHKLETKLQQRSTEKKEACEMLNYTKYYEKNGELYCTPVYLSSTKQGKSHKKEKRDDARYSANQPLKSTRSEQLEKKATGNVDDTVDNQTKEYKFSETRSSHESGVVSTEYQSSEPSIKDESTELWNTHVSTNLSSKNTFSDCGEQDTTLAKFNHCSCNQSSKSFANRDLSTQSALCNAVQTEQCGVCSTQQTHNNNREHVYTSYSNENIITAQSRTKNGSHKYTDASSNGVNAAPASPYISSSDVCVSAVVNTRTRSQSGKKFLQSSDGIPFHDTFDYNAYNTCLETKL